MSREPGAAGASNRKKPRNDADGDASKTMFLSLELKEEDSDNVISVWSSVDKCVFCNKFLNRDTKLLECLHKICYRCYEIKMTTNTTGVKCKCGTVSIDNIDFPIESPSGHNVKICSSYQCNKTAEKMCVLCETFHCQPCVDVHLESDEDHRPRHIFSCSTNIKSYLCPICVIKNVEVLCVKCAEVMCSLCLLKKHKSHKYKILKDVCRDTNQKWFTEKLKFEESNNYINFCMENTEGEMKKLKTKYKLIIENIDKYTNDLFVKLSIEITKHQRELKSIVEKQFDILETNAMYNKRILQGLQKKNSYYISFLKSIENHKEIYHRFRLTELIAQKLDGVHHTGDDVSQILLNLKFDLELLFDDTAWETFVTRIKSAVKVISSSENNVKTENENPQLECLNNQIKKEEETNEFNLDNFSSDYKPYMNCSCCNQLNKFGKLVQCTSCQRLYHTYCHIPCLPTEYTNTDKIREEWKCIMCIDVFDSSPIFKDNFILGVSEQKILGRILMELYCQSDESGYFRELINREDYPQYYEKITSPISLNNIRDRLQLKIKPYYTSIDEVVNDMIKIFLNAISYYPSSDPCYLAAYTLKTLLIQLVYTFLPQYSYLICNI